MEAEEGIVVDMVLEVCVEDSEGVCRVLVDQAEASGEGGFAVKEEAREECGETGALGRRMVI